MPMQDIGRTGQDQGDSDHDRVLMRGGDFEGGRGTFLRVDTGAVTYLRTTRLLIKES